MIGRLKLLAKADFISAKADSVQWIRAGRKCCLETHEPMDSAKRWMQKLKAAL
jgi:hypothetical protein